MVNLKFYFSCNLASNTNKKDCFTYTGSYWLETQLINLSTNK